MATKKRLKNDISSSKEGKKPFQCSICHAHLVSMEKLQKHVDTTHLNLTPDKCENYPECSSQKIKCELCKMTTLKSIRYSPKHGMLIDLKNNKLG